MHEADEHRRSGLECSGEGSGEWGGADWGCSGRADSVVQGRGRGVGEASERGEGQAQGRRLWRRLRLGIGVELHTYVRRRKAWDLLMVYVCMCVCLFVETSDVEGRVCCKKGVLPAPIGNVEISR